MQSKKVNELFYTDADDSDVHLARAPLPCLELPDTPWRPSAADQSLARKLHQEAVPFAARRGRLAAGLIALARTAFRASALAQGPLPRLLPPGPCRDATDASSSRLPRLSSPQVP